MIIVKLFSKKNDVKILKNTQTIGSVIRITSDGLWDTQLNEGNKNEKEFYKQKKFREPMVHNGKVFLYTQYEAKISYEMSGLNVMTQISAPFM